jgi:conjugative relaxase-like TrwC/TraI family protein
MGSVDDDSLITGALGDAREEANVRAHRGRTDKEGDGKKMRWKAISNCDYAEYLEREEKEQAERVLWEGKIAERLGIAGQKVTPESFSLLTRGIDPETGEVLRPRERHALTRNGKIMARPIALYEAGFSPGKSVSIVGMVDPRIEQAHKETVREMAPSIESLAMVRRNRQLHPTGEAIYAAYHHQISRALDPQIHTHLTFPNLTHDQRKGEWRALGAYRMYQARFPLHERYREVLAERVTNLGYSITERADRGAGWEIEGVSRDLMEKYSQRSLERDQACAGFEQHHGRKPNCRETDVLVLTHRPEKVYLPAEVIRERQLERLTPKERIQLTDVRERARERVSHPLMDHVESEPGLSVRPWSYGREIKPDAWG